MYCRYEHCTAVWGGVVEGGGKVGYMAFLPSSKLLPDSSHCASGAGAGLFAVVIGSLSSQTS